MRNARQTILIVMLVCAGCRVCGSGYIIGTNSFGPEKLDEKIKESTRP